MIDADEADEDDAWYVHELVGLSVVRPDGTLVGEVVDLLDMPAHDLLVVRQPSGFRAMIPFVEQFVPEVDIEARPRGHHAAVRPARRRGAGEHRRDGRRATDEMRVRIDVITIFPEFFSVLDVSLLGKARAAALVQTHVHDLRDWTQRRPPHGRRRPFRRRRRNGDEARRLG